MNKRILLFIGCVIIFLANNSYALEMILKPRPLSRGDIVDGSIIATGRILCREPHTAFYVRSDELNISDGKLYYMLRGMDGHTKIKLRLSGEGWSQIMTGDGVGMIKLSAEPSVNFDIAIDGNQRIIPDRYQLTLLGGCK